VGRVRNRGPDRLVVGKGVCSFWRCNVKIISRQRVGRIENIEIELNFVAEYDSTACPVLPCTGDLFLVQFVSFDLLHNRVSGPRFRLVCPSTANQVSFQRWDEARSSPDEQTERGAQGSKRRDEKGRMRDQMSDKVVFDVPWLYFNYNDVLRIGILYLISNCAGENVHKYTSYDVDVMF